MNLALNTDKLAERNRMVAADGKCQILRLVNIFIQTMQQIKNIQPTG